MGRRPAFPARTGTPGTPGGSRPAPRGRRAGMRPPCGPSRAKGSLPSGTDSARSTVTKSARNGTVRSASSCPVRMTSRVVPIRVLASPRIARRSRACRLSVTSTLTVHTPSARPCASSRRKKEAANACSRRTFVGRKASYSTLMVGTPLSSTWRISASSVSVPGPGAASVSLRPSRCWRGMPSWKPWVSFTQVQRSRASRITTPIGRLLGRRSAAGSDSTPDPSVAHEGSVASSVANTTHRARRSGPDSDCTYRRTSILRPSR